MLPSIVLAAPFTSLGPEVQPGSLTHLVQALHLTREGSEAQRG